MGWPNWKGGTGRQRIKSGPTRCFPFCLPRTDNANYLWIQLFHSALRANGHTGFVMANPVASPLWLGKEGQTQLLC
jgi:type I restriction enzyme M protein